MILNCFPPFNKTVENAIEKENLSSLIFTHQFGKFNHLEDDWQYILSIDKRVADKVTPEILVDIANSFQSES